MQPEKVSCAQGGDHQIGWINDRNEALEGYVGCIDCKEPADKIPKTEPRQQVTKLWASTVK